MPREWFQNYKPKDDSLDIVTTAGQIIRDYQRQGLRLTLRQLYYQFVSRDILPNTEKSYKRLGTIVSRGRLAGYLDWDAIEDRVRVPNTPPEYDSLNDLMDAAFYSFRLPRLTGQLTYVELWVEKDALAGVLQPIARDYHVTLMVNRGYSSSSAMKEAGDRLRSSCDKYGCEKALILYLGDLDPSGEDMVRDIRDRVEQFLNQGRLIKQNKEGKLVLEKNEAFDKRKPYIDFRVEKLALTMDQVDEYEPPPNPTKLTDSRAKDFIEKYGYSSWEVDALDPRTLRDIITEALDLVIDRNLVEDVKRQEKEDKAKLRAALESLE